MGAPKMGQNAPRWRQDASKMSPRWLKTPKMRPRWSQDGPKMAQDAPKMAPRWPQDGSKMLQDGPKIAPRCTKDGLRYLFLSFSFRVGGGYGLGVQVFRVALARRAP